MKNLNLKKYILSLFIVSLSWSAFALKPDIQPEAKQDARNIAAEAKLKANPDTVSIYARGLCCPSCSIGVRKMVSKLDFVNKKRFTKGVDLDAKMQLVTVAVKPNMEIDPAALSKAVDNAGYTPVHLYRLIDGKLDTKALSTEKDK